MRIFYLITVCILISSCTEKEYSRTIFSVWQLEEETRCGNFLFGINDSLYIHRNYSSNDFELKSTNDFEYNLVTERHFRQVNISSEIKSVNSLQLASYVGEVRWPMIGELYNLKINNSIWNVDLYWPYDDIKGSYQFEVTEGEKKLTLLLIHDLIKNLDGYYFPAKEDQASPVVFASSLYVAIDSLEYFGATFSNSCELLMIHQWVVLIIENYFSPEQKISDDFNHLNIRERFNEYVEKDDITGFFLFDYDEVMKEIEEFPENDE